MLNLQWERDLTIIKETIIRACDKFDNVLLWQNINGEKVMIPCLITNIDPIDNKVTLYFNHTINVHKLDPQVEIFGRCNERSLIFKSTVDDIIKNEIVINVPTEVRVLECRSYTRNIFGVDSHIYSTVDKVEEDLLGKSNFNLRLYDISQSGASFVVKTNEKKLFKVGETLKISSFDQFEMDTPLECQVCHLTDVLQKNATSSYSFRKMGVKFDFSLPEAIYLNILERIVSGG